MAAVFAGLDGKAGLPGWRWMYIICGCISFPSAVWTWLAIPQLPSRLKKNWIFTQEEVEIARARMPTERKPLTGLFKWKDIKRWHTTWHAFLFPLLFAFMAQFGQSGQSMIFWVKSYNVKGQAPVFSVPQINLIPLGINIVTIVCTLINAWVSDSLPGSLRWPGVLFASLMAIIFPIALAATPVHPTVRAQRWVLYYLTSLTGTAAGITWTWVNEVNRHDPEKRAYVSALMNAFGEFDARLIKGHLIHYKRLTFSSIHLHRLGAYLHLPCQQATIHRCRELCYSWLRSSSGGHCPFDATSSQSGP
jgi:ACS family pantothenate transporter-like MFS transporter